MEAVVIMAMGHGKDRVGVVMEMVLVGAEDPLVMDRTQVF